MDKKEKIPAPMVLYSHVGRQEKKKKKGRQYQALRDVIRKIAVVDRNKRMGVDGLL